MGIYFKVKKVQLQMMHDRGYSLNGFAALNALLAATRRQPLTEPALHPEFYGLIPIDETPLLSYTREQMTAYYTQSGQVPFNESALNQIYVRQNASTQQLEACWIYYDDNKSEANFGSASKTSFLSAFGNMVVLRQNSLLKYIIIVLNNKTLTAGPNGSLETLQKNIEPHHKITIFQTDELAINPTQHIFAPEIYRLRPDEQSEHMAGKIRSRLPAMRQTDLATYKEFADPVAKYYGFDPGTEGDVIRIQREIFYAPTIIRQEIGYRVVQKMV